MIYKLLGLLFGAFGLTGSDCETQEKGPQITFTGSANVVRDRKLDSSLKQRLSIKETYLNSGTRC